MVGITGFMTTPYAANHPCNKNHIIALHAKYPVMKSLPLYPLPVG